MRVAVLLCIVIGLSAGSAAAQDKALIEKAKVYADQKCGVCHSIDGKGNAKGPLDSMLSLKKRR